VVVETPSGMEAYGVLLAPAGRVWMARILTHPRSLWTIPGGRGVMKFVGSTPQEAQERAIRFVEEHCAKRGHVPRTGLSVIEAPPASLHAAALARALSPARRWPVVLPVRYGLDALMLRGVTRDISEGGVFVRTPSPMAVGLEIALQLSLARGAVDLQGAVVWKRLGSDTGRPPGMGIRLARPPEPYLKYIRSLSGTPVEGP